MKQALLLILFLLFYSVFSEEIVKSYTTISDSIGPFFLSNDFIDDSSVTVDPLDSLKLPPYRYFSTSHKLFFEYPLAKGQKFSVTFSTKFTGIKETYSLFDKSEYSSKDSSDIIDSSKAWLNSIDDNNRIKLSGEKSIGVSLGGGSGASAINQSLDVTLFGDLGDSVKISGRISDKSSSLQGTTRELGELEKIYLTVESSRWKVTAGDLDILSAEGGITEKERKSKGIFASINNGKYFGEVFGGIGGDRKGYNRFNATGGVQSGGYRLTGVGESGFIMPVYGSVNLYVDGVKLDEGGDYDIDYNIGEIQFLPTYPLKEDQIIEVHYRYREFQYGKLLGGSNLSINNKLFSVFGSVYGEHDDPNSSDKVLTASELEAIKNSGDNPPDILSGIIVHPNDVIQESARSRVYRLDTTLLQYNWESKVEENAHIFDHYTVNFYPSDSGLYLPFSLSNRDSFYDYDSLFLDSVSFATINGYTLDPIYLFVGSDRGHFTPYSSPILPENRVEGEVGVSFSPSDQFKVTINGAGRYRDRNSLSKIKTVNPNSGAFKGALYLSTNKDRFAVVGVELNGNYGGRDFTQDVVSSFDKWKIWGIEEDSTVLGTWNSHLSLDLNNRYSLFVDGGQGYLGNSLASTLFSAGISQNEKRVINQNYKWVQRVSNGDIGSGHRENYGLNLDFNLLKIDISAEEEWYEKSNIINGGHFFSIGKINFSNIGWSNRFEYKNMRLGIGNIFNSEDSGTILLWQQIFKRDLNDYYSINFTNSIQKQSFIAGDTATTVLFSYRDRGITPSKLIQSSIEINESIESATERRWQYIPVPLGSGTHIKDSITGSFIPSLTGDYIAKEIINVSSNPSRVRTVRNMVSWQWSAKHRYRGVVADGFQWSGHFWGEEDVFPKNRSLGVVNIPLFSSFSRDTEDSLNYSRLAYTQTVRWLPPSIANFSSSESFTAENSRSQSTIYKKLSSQFQVSKGFGHFLLSLEFPSFIEKREGVSAALLKDIAIIPTQDYGIGQKVVHLFLKEGGGLIKRDKISGNYLLISPGVKIITKKSGVASLSYTLGNVNFVGDLLSPMAMEFKKGINHRFLLKIGINSKKYLSFNGFLRSDKNRDSNWNTMASMGVTLKI